MSTTDPHDHSDLPPYPQLHRIYRQGHKTTRLQIAGILLLSGGLLLAMMLWMFGAYDLPPRWLYTGAALLGGIGGAMFAPTLRWAGVLGGVFYGVVLVGLFRAYARLGLDWGIAGDLAILVFLILVAVAAVPGLLVYVGLRQALGRW